MLPSLYRSGSGIHEDLVRWYILLYLKNKVQSNLIYNNQKDKKDNDIWCNGNNGYEGLHAQTSKLF